MKPRNLVWVVSAAFAVVLGVAVGGFVRAGRAEASGSATVGCRADFPVTGITGRERAVVHAAWVDSDGDPVNARIAFFDKNGHVLLEREHALPPGETVSSELRMRKPRSEGEGEDKDKGGQRGDNDSDGQLPRLEFRAAVVLTTGSGEEGFPAGTGCPGVLVSLERLSSRGETLGFVPPGCAIGHMCEKHEHEPKPSPCPICPPPPTDVFPVTDFGPPVDLRPPSDFGVPTDVTTFPTDFFAPLVDLTLPSDLVRPPIG